MSVKDKNTFHKHGLVICSTNQFLCKLLEHTILNSNIDCKITSETSIKVALSRYPGPALVLIDCFNEPYETILNKLWTALDMNLVNYKFVLFNLNRDTGIETVALNLGVRGFFYNDTHIETIKKGIHALLNGDIWASRKGMFKCISDKANNKRNLPKEKPILESKLTSREQEILSVLSTGKSNAFIADELCLSHHTVRTHIYNIFRKIGVNTRSQATLWYLQRD
jgi:LuxR family transcriptional regulator of csgAB operon